MNETYVGEKKELVDNCEKEFQYSMNSGFVQQPKEVRRGRTRRQDQWPKVCRYCHQVSLQVIRSVFRSSGQLVKSGLHQLTKNYSPFICMFYRLLMLISPADIVYSHTGIVFVFRHVAVSPQVVDTTDKFRIHMFEDGTNEVSY